MHPGNGVTNTEPDGGLGWELDLKWLAPIGVLVPIITFFVPVDVWMRILIFCVVVPTHHLIWLLLKPPKSRNIQIVLKMVIVACLVGLVADLLVKDYQIRADAETGLKRIRTDAETGLSKIRTDAETRLSTIHTDAETSLNIMQTNAETDLRRIQTNAETRLSQMQANAETRLKTMQDVIARATQLANEAKGYADDANRHANRAQDSNAERVWKVNAVIAADMVIQAASLHDLQNYIKYNIDSLTRPEAIEHLHASLRGEGLPWQKRGNAAICLALLEAYDEVESAFKYKDDPSVQSWLVGAAHLWVKPETLSQVLRWLDSENRQVRIGAAAALGIAGPQVFSNEISKKDTEDKLHRLQEEAFGRDAGFENTIHWTLKRLGLTSNKETISPGRPERSMWYKSAQGLIMIGLSKCWLDTEGETPEAPSFFLSEAEVTHGTFKSFINAPDSKYKTTSAERTGFSNSMDIRYRWASRAQATWRDLRLAGETLTILDSDPVVHVSWVDAAHFCNWLTQEDRKSGEKLEPYYRIEGDRITKNINANGYRLPTRVEWRCSAMADTRTKFWWGRFEPLEQPDWRKDPLWKGMVANLPDSELKRLHVIVDAIAGTDGYKFAAPVGEFRPNPFGFFDMIGNVAEWCDWPDEREDTKKPIMGGSWGDDLESCSPYDTHRTEPMTDSHVNVGFRVARNAN